MTKQQNIFFDNKLNFKIAEGGIIEQDTEILNLFFGDGCDNNSLCLIGKCLEWKPLIWMDYEQDKFKKLKEINIVCLLGDLTELFYYLKKKYKNIQVNYYNHNLFFQQHPIRSSLANKKYLPTRSYRKITVYASIGTMRLNRYILLKEAMTMGYNFYHPAISFSLSSDFEYQICQCLDKEMQTPTEFKERRLFGEMSQEEFNAKQIELLCESYINIVATFPNTDWLRDKDDEKYFDTILSKSIPFMLCEKDSNSSGVELLGFLPYEGFSLKNDGNDNPVLRWKSLLEDNKHIFKNKEMAQELYDKNQKVIEHNYNRLVNTDWEYERLSQFDRLPNFIKDYLNCQK